MQEPSGAIPWAPGEHVDVWNHVEVAMALTDVVRAGERGVHLAEVGRQGRDRPGLQPPDPAGAIDRPLEIHRTAEVSRRGQGARPEVCDLIRRQDRLFVVAVVAGIRLGSLLARRVSPEGARRLAVVLAGLGAISALGRGVLELVG